MHGDAQLKLNLEGLNGYAAMMATMKEMGYESEGEEDEETGKPQESPSLTSQSANANAPNAAAANAKKQGKKKKRKNEPRDGSTVGQPGLHGSRPISRSCDAHVRGCHHCHCGASGRRGCWGGRVVGHKRTTEAELAHR